jgi:hypothetical protein
VQAFHLLYQRIKVLLSSQQASASVLKLQKKKKKKIYIYIYTCILYKLTSIMMHLNFTSEHRLLEGGNNKSSHKKLSDMFTTVYYCKPTVNRCFGPHFITTFNPMCVIHRMTRSLDHTNTSTRSFSEAFRLSSNCLRS